MNEDMARRAKDANSFSEYREGSATAAYRAEIVEATEIAERQKKRVDPMYHDKIDALLDRYARKLAANYNDRNRIDASCPSVLVAGPSNFPVRKKEKQNAARDRSMSEYQDIRRILDRIQSTGTGGIQSGDPAALVKLHDKLDRLERLQVKMKAVNAYYRKHNSLDGCPELTPDVVDKLTASMDKLRHYMPYEGWALSNNNAEIHRVRDRINQLEAVKESVPAEVEDDMFRYVENTELMRVQFFFDGKPDESTRDMLKSNGFRWAPSLGAWQRQLTPNGQRAARAVIKYLRGE